MKKIVSLIVIAGIAVLFYASLPLTNQEYVDDEYITDEGFYLRFDGIQCESTQHLNVKLGLSPVRHNDYNSCQAVDIKLGLLKEDDHHGEIFYLWETSNCVAGKVRQEAVEIGLSNYFTSEQLTDICENRNLYSIVLRDFKFIAPPKQNINTATSDPLGQQARLDSSIPRDDQVAKLFDLNAAYSDKKVILLIQKKLSLLSDYGGPFDGVWNIDMDSRIKEIQDDNLILFDDIKSLKTLELLGLES